MSDNNYEHFTVDLTSEKIVCVPRPVPVKEVIDLSESFCEEPKNNIVRIKRSSKDLPSTDPLRAKSSKSTCEDTESKSKIVRIKRSVEDLKSMSTASSTAKSSESRSSEKSDKIRVKSGRSLDDSTNRNIKKDEYSRYRGKRCFDDSVIRRTSYGDSRLTASRDEDRKSHRKRSRDSSNYTYKKRENSPCRFSRIDSKYRKRKYLDDSVIKEVCSIDKRTKYGKWHDDSVINNGRNISHDKLKMSQSDKKESHSRSSKSLDDSDSSRVKSSVIKHKVEGSRMRNRSSDDSEIRSVSRRPEKKWLDDSELRSNTTIKIDFKQTKCGGKNAKTKKTDIDHVNRLTWRGDEDKLKNIGSMDDSCIGTKNSIELKSKVNTGRSLDDSFIQNRSSLDEKTGQVCEYLKDFVPNGGRCLAVGATRMNIEKDLAREDDKPINLYGKENLKSKSAEKSDIEISACKTSFDCSPKSNVSAKCMKPFCEVNNVEKLQKETEVIQKVDKKLKSNDMVTSQNVKQRKRLDKKSNYENTFTDCISRLAWQKDAHKFKRIESLDDSLIGTRSPGSLSRVNTVRSLDDSDIPDSPPLGETKSTGYPDSVTKGVRWLSGRDMHFKISKKQDLRCIENFEQKSASKVGNNGSIIMGNEISSNVKKNNCEVDNKIVDGKVLETSGDPRQILVNNTSESLVTGFIHTQDRASTKNVQSNSNVVSEFSGDSSLEIESDQTLELKTSSMKISLEPEKIQSISGQVVKLKPQEDLKVTRSVNLGNLKLLTPTNSKIEASKSLKLPNTCESNISEKSKDGKLKSGKTKEIKDLETPISKPKRVEDLRKRISDGLKRRLSVDVQPDNILTKKSKNTAALKLNSSVESNSGSFTSLKTKTSEILKPSTSGDMSSKALKEKNLVDSKPIIKKISFSKESNKEGKKISDVNKASSSTVEDSKKKNDNLKRKVSESLAVEGSKEKKVKGSAVLQSKSLKTLSNLVITACGEARNSSLGSYNNEKRVVEVTSIKDKKSKPHSEEKKSKVASTKDNKNTKSDEKDLRTKLTNNAKAKEINTSPEFMQDFNAVLDCEETELIQQVKKRWGCDSIPSPEINLTCSNYWRKRQEGKGSKEKSILEGFHRYSPLIERLMGTDFTSGAKLGRKRKRQNPDIFVDPSDRYRWDGKKPKVDNESNDGSSQVTASLHEQLKKAERNYRLRYQEARDHQDNQAYMLKQQHERRVADLQQHQTQEMQYLYSNSYDVQGLHSPFYSLRNKHRSQLYNLQLEHNRNMSRLEERTKRRICEERKSYSDIEGQLQQLVSQEERRADKAGPKVPYKTVRLAKGPCRANKQTKSWVELLLPEDIGAAMIQEDLIYDTFYKY